MALICKPPSSFPTSKCASTLLMSLLAIFSNITLITSPRVSDILIIRTSLLLHGRQHASASLINSFEAIPYV